MDNWHPLIVHFPLVLLPLSVGLDLAALALRRPQWHGLAYAFLWLGAGLSAAAVLSGNAAAAAHRQDPQVGGLVADHESWATWVLFLSFALALGRLPLQLQHRFGGPRFALWLAFALVACGMLWITGYTGGELVFRHGVGVNIQR